jgi:hypothetical protein
MLNSNWNTEYKKLAKTTKYSECAVSEEPFNTLIVDFKSRVFRYIRLVYMKRPLNKKITSVFSAMNDLQKEKKMVFHNALAFTKREIAAINPKKCKYVFCSLKTCVFKKGIEVERAKILEKRSDNLKSLFSELRLNVFDMTILKKCCAALESYIISDVDNICTMYEGIEWSLGIENYEIPREVDYYESSRLCADLSAKSNSSIIFSENFDCVALFGAEFMVIEMFDEFMSYVTLKDVMKAFGVTNRKDMVHRCCLMGTYFNLGMKGIGPIKAKQLDAPKAAELFNTCIRAQHITHKDIYKFFNLSTN